MRQKIIIDTDIGDDIDDALAIALALKSPELEIAGITTVWGRVDLRTRLALKLLQVFNRPDIPVATGTGIALCGRQDTHIPSQTQIVGPEEKLQPRAEQDAVDFIISMVKTHPKEILLLPIGALTNVASAISKEPHLKRDLKGIVLMGGVIGEKMAEYNISCDPEAADIVFSSGIPIKMIGLDVTMKCRLTGDELSRILKDKKTTGRFLSELIYIWQGGNPQAYPVLHDPLAVATVIDPAIVKTERKAIEVDIGSGAERGFTKVVSGEPNAEVAVEVERDRFVSMFLERITQGQSSFSDKK